MPVRQGCLGTAIISKDVLGVLDVGIARLRSNGGRCVISGDNEDTAFWLNGKQPERDITNVDAAISDYYFTINQLRHVHDGLVSMLHSVTTQMTKLNTQMLPIVYRRGIEKIPDEILTRVLVLAFDYDPDTRQRLRLVCKRFCKVIDKQPAFWAIVATRMKPKDIIKRMKRTGSLGLTVKLDDDYSRYDTIQDAVDELVRHLSRWRHVEADFNNRLHLDLAGVYDSLEDLHLPWMRSLTLTCNEESLGDSHSTSDGYDPIYTTWNAPNLASIVSINVIPDPIPGMRLTHCTISLRTRSSHAWHFSDILAFFKTTPALETLVLQFKSATSKKCTSHTAIELQRLRVMTIQVEKSDLDNNTDNHLGPIIRMMEAIKTPTLGQFTLQINGGPFGKDDDFVCDIINSRGHSSYLRDVRVIIRDSRFESCMLAAMLVGLPRLEQLTIDCPDVRLGIEPLLGLPERHPLRLLHLNGYGTLVGRNARNLLSTLSDKSRFPDFETLVLERCMCVTLCGLPGVQGLELVTWRV